MSQTLNMIAPSAGQVFSGNPSGATYAADNYGGVFAVALQDMFAMMKAGCTIQSGDARVVVPASGSAYTMQWPSFGNIWYDITLSANCALSIGAGSPDAYPQVMRVIIRPNGFQATLPASGGSLINSGGAPPVPSTSAVTEYAYASEAVTTELGGI